MTARLAWRRTLPSRFSERNFWAKAANRSATYKQLGLVRRVEAVGEATQRRPFHQADDPAHAALVGVAGLLLHPARRKDDLVVGALREELRAASLLQAVDRVERLGDGAADGERAVVAEQHHVAIAEVGDHALPLVEVERH